jgi:hypothetical protein
VILCVPGVDVLIGCLLVKELVQDSLVGQSPTDVGEMSTCAESIQLCF